MTAPTGAAVHKPLTRIISSLTVRKLFRTYLTVDRFSKPHNR